MRGREHDTQFICTCQKRNFRSFDKLLNRSLAAFSEGDEARTAASGGCPVRAEISRNEQCPHDSAERSEAEDEQSLDCRPKPTLKQSAERGVYRGLALIEAAEPWGETALSAIQL